MKPKITIQLPEELLDELKDCVVFLLSKDPNASMSKFIAEAIQAALDGTKLRYNRAKFPKRAGALRVGRRVE